MHAAAAAARARNAIVLDVVHAMDVPLVGEAIMRTTLKAVAAATAASSGLVACGDGAVCLCARIHVYRGVCQPVTPPSYSNPVSGAVSGEAAGASRGYATGGPVGAVVGGAIGTATGTLSGTANMLSPPASCGPGYRYYNGACYPVR